MPTNKHPHATDPQWFDNPICLSELWSWLSEIGETPDDPAYFMEKAYKWTDEWERYLDAYENGEI